MQELQTLNDDKFIIKKVTRLMDVFENMDVIGAIERRENYRKQQDLPIVDDYCNKDK